MKIIVPIHYENERLYVLNTIFNYLFEIIPEIEIKEVPNYLIILNTESQIEIEDHFFSNYINDTYLKLSAVPSKISFLNSNFCSEENIPVLYGIPEVHISNIHPKKILIKFDLIAGIFFMLSRWEEYVNPKKDLHNRFPLSESIAYKHNFYQRPIVNESIEFLWNIITKLDGSLVRIQRLFTFSLTHDVDSIFCPPPTIKNLGRILFKNHDLPLFFKTLYFQTLTNPHDSFRYLMELSEKVNTTSTFYLMTGNTDMHDFEDYSESRLFNERLLEIRKRSHQIGLHPSYNSYNNFDLMHSEKLKLEALCGSKIENVRQHFLRLELPLTFVYQEKCKFKTDSSLGYVEDIGFRCGICYEFPIFDFLAGKQLKIIEKPLIAMEGSLVGYRKLNPDETLKEITQIIEKVKKYNGDFIFLWHNNSFNKGNWFKFQFIYEAVINILNGK